jgi:phospholipid/cholesterol/gamma-HCH transport system substrate-binding protein
VNRRPIAVALAAASAVAVLLPACSREERDTYHLTAYFERAISLYAHGDVIVMGIDVGTVDAVEIEDTRVRVELSIRSDVPLPDDVQATIEPLTLIGERNVHLFPAWTAEMAAAGQGRAQDGDEIPLERTQVPVEPDEGLEAFNDLAQSLDPEVVGQLVTDSAGALEGQGENIATAIDQAAELTSLFASLDTQLVAAAENLDQVAASLDTRDAQLRTLVTSFADATGVLAAERDSIATFLSSLVGLTQQGQSILDLYGAQLPGDIANLTTLLLVLDGHDEAIDQLLAAFPMVTEAIRDAYRPSIDGFNLVANPTPSFVGIYDNFLENLGLLVPEGG